MDPSIGSRSAFPALSRQRRLVSRTGILAPHLFPLNNARTGHDPLPLIWRVRAVSVSSPASLSGLATA
jgi:hypothetical protein